MNAELENLRQRADYTHKFNLKNGRHGWLRLTPAYSVKIVEELISRCDHAVRVLDPFCGTGTTGLCAAYRGHSAVTTDINPFLVWFAQAKTDNYSPKSLAATCHACTQALSLVKKKQVQPVAAPPIHRIERWWKPSALMFLRTLRSGIEAASSPGTPEKTLLLVAFCRTAIALSSAAFNHQSMSFKDGAQTALPLVEDMASLFAQDVRFVLRGAEENPRGVCQVIPGDARKLNSVVEGAFNCVITSPPYANRMSYIRELRPYMYWLGFLVNGRDAGELDWSAIGGTWGIATSRLTVWERNADSLKDEMLEAALERIAHEDNKSGRILANYVAKYFDDMWTHVQSLPTVLASGAEVHYVLGNSTFYGVSLPVENIYVAMFRKAGFDCVRCQPIRKRNSKKDLIEFDVTGRWSG